MPDRAGSVVELVESQAARTPSAPAVVQGGEMWSYRRLDLAAAGIARSLQDCGVGPGTFVAVCVGRSPWLVAAILGVWRAGAAVVPLDSPAAIDRLRRASPATGPRVGVHDGVVPELPGVPVWHALTTRPSTEEVKDFAAVPQDDAAYLVFTSGSSGRPKGIVGVHGGVRHYFDAMRAAGHLVAGDTVVQLTAVSFDASLRDMFLPLTVGARTVIAPDGGRDVAAALGLMVSYGATVIPAVVPSLMRELVREARRLGIVLTSVRVVLLSGERLYPADVSAMREVFPNARIVNMYGPSETTMTATAFEVRDTPGDIPVGRPLPHVSVHVLDDASEPVPPGQVGEVHIGGAGLTRGYWHDPRRTAACFVPDPFGEPGARMYRTGDRGRVRADGELEFVGRTDDQVKIRGQRVELGEIETALRALPGVREAACVVREPAPGETSLVAYLVAGGTVTVGELRAGLAARLPDAVLPDTYVHLDRLPRTTSGKVDRQALPQPGPARSDLLGGAASASTPEEKAMAAVWREVLDVPEVGVHDTFFELGGHSLLAMRLVARISDAFGVAVPLSVVFETPTVAALTQYVTRYGGGAAAEPAPVAAGRAPRLSPSQAHIWSVNRLAAGGPCHNVAGILRFRGELDTGAVARATTEIVRRHESLRMTFPEVAGQPVARVHPSEPVPLSSVDLRSGGEAALYATVRDLAWRGFDLAEGPLLRAGLIRTADDEHIYYTVVHHIVFDGTSMGNYFRELTTLYGAYATGRPSPLPEVALQYPDLATWQAEQIDAGTWAGDLAYWRDRLTGTAPLVDVPDGYPFTSPTQQRRGQVASVVDADHTRALARLAAERGATLSMLLLAAFQAALHLVDGAERFHVATPVANRARPERRDMIGFVANTLLLAADVSGDPTYLELVARTRTTVLDGYTHAEPPLESVLDGLLPGTATPALRLAQAMFNMQEAPEPEGVAVAGVAVTPADTPDTWARYPITLFVSQTTELALVFVYDSVLFDAEWAGSVTGALHRVVKSAVDGEDVPLSALWKEM